MKALPYYLAILVLGFFIVSISYQQLSQDASPAAGFCQKAEKAGYACVVGPTYQAQVVGVDDGMGTRSTILIVSDGKQTLSIIPLE